MAQFVLTKGGSVLGMKKRTLSYQVRLGSVTISLFLIFFFCIVALLSLRHFIQSTTAGYRLRELEDKRYQLLTEYQINSMLVDRVRSLAAIENSQTVKRMVKFDTTKTVFIDDDFAVAAK